MGQSQNTKGWIGVVLVAFGAFFLLRNFGLIPYFIPHYFFGWKAILVLVGVSMLVTGRKREGLLFLLIGVFFLLPDIFQLPHISMRDWWPVILIVVGIGVFLRRRDQTYRRSGAVGSDYFEDVSIFGGSEKYFTSRNFKGGKITCIFGGSEINFSEADIGEEEAVLDVFCLFGGNEIRVPNEWTVVNDSFVIFGGHSDSRSGYSERNPGKVLRIKGSIIFGGNEIKGI